MKKIIVRILLVLLALLVIWILAHRFDASLNPDLFTEADIPAASFDYSNGFYDLWTLAEPPEVDVSSPQVKEKYRKLFDPQFDTEKNIEAYDYNNYKLMHKLFSEKYKKIGITLVHPGGHVDRDWCREVLEKKELLSSLDPDLQVYFNRFRDMMDKPVWEDFISVKADVPLPNLLAWLHAAKLYTAVNILTALEGDWDKGVSNLLDMVDFAKRAVKGSRFLIVNLVAKAMYQLSTQAILDLMNRKECPNAIYELVLSRTPPLEYEQYGSRKTIICELAAFTFDFIDHPFRYDPYRGLNFFERSLVLLFLQKNRTKNYANEFYKQFIEKEQAPPYTWDSYYVQIEPLKEGPFWWLWNAGGKFLLTAYNSYTGNHKKNDGLYAIIFKSYLRKTYYDMMRISAELHLKYDPEKPVQEILNSLDSYKVLDPCSGKPYIWKDDRQILYGIGLDRKDNGGMDTTRYTQIEGVDYTIPVILF